jgi:hypothetical protein
MQIWDCSSNFCLLSVESFIPGLKTIMLNRSPNQIYTNPSETPNQGRYNKLWQHKKTQLHRKMITFLICIKHSSKTSLFHQNTHITTSSKRIQQQMKEKWQLSDPKRHQNSIKTTFSIPKDNQQTLNR